MKISLVGDLIAKNKFRTNLDYEIYSLKAYNEITKLLYSEIPETIKEKVSIYISGESDLTFIAIKALEELIEYLPVIDIEVFYVIPYVSFFKRMCKADRERILKLVKSEDNIIIMDKVYKLPKNLKVAKRAEYTQRFMLSSCDKLIHVWKGDMKEFNKHTALLRGSKKCRFVMDANSFEVLEVY